MAYKNLVEMLESSCRKYWWRKAVLGEDRILRYYKLRRLIDRFASLLVKREGVTQEDRVAVLLGNSSIYPVVYFSILKAGGVVVPLNTFLKGEELKFILNNSGAKLLVTSRDFSPVIQEIRPNLDRLMNVIFVDEETGSDLWREKNGVVKVRADGSTLVPTYVGTSTVSGATPACAEGISPGMPGALAAVSNISGDSTAVIIYTSGTTGFPKGAMLTHENLLTNLESSITVSFINNHDRMLCVLPMFHSFTMTVCMLMPLSVGAGIVIATSLHQFKKVFKRILFLGVTIIAGIPPLYSALAKAEIPLLAKFLLKIRLCISGAAPLPETVLNEFEKKWKIPLLEGYGLSETSPVVSLNPIKGKRKPNSVGLPVPGVSVKIVNTDEAELPVDTVGEIIIKGKNVMKGYYNNKEATKETIRGGWLFTGDMGKIDEEGYIYIVDRKKDMILVRGLNVYPREVENVLQECPGIKESAVVGKPDPNKGEVPAAFVIAKDGAKLNHGEIIKFCRQRLADYKVPRQIIEKAELPRTPTGKILKRELQKLIHEQETVIY